MSHRANSIAAMALLSTGPPRAYSLRYIAWTRRSIVERRGAEHIAGGHVVDGGGDGARLPLHRALAEPGEPGVGVHAGENEIVPPMAHQEHFNAGDLHALPPAGACAHCRREIHNLLIQVYRIFVDLDRICRAAASEERGVDQTNGQEFQPFSPRHQRPSPRHRRRGPCAGRVAQDRGACGALRR